MRRAPPLRRLHVPAPLVGGFAAALLLAALRAAGAPVTVPTEGLPLDALVGLLSTNMGLHVTPHLLRRAAPVFLVFTLTGAALFLVQLALALATGLPLPLALLGGPVALVGAPFNLNPPDQMQLLPPLGGADVAKGAMMLGVVAALVLPALVGRRLARGDAPDDKRPPDERRPKEDVWKLARHAGIVVALVFLLIAAAYLLQRALLARFGALAPDHVPIIVLSYLLAAATRLAWEALLPEGSFPKLALDVVLLGPTMALVLSYAVLSVPLHLLAQVPARLWLSLLLGIGASVAASLVVHRLATRRLDAYDAAVVAAAFLAATTAWGPVAMSYLRRFTGEEGPVEPMPVILPLHAFYVFPWTTVLLTHAVLALAPA